MEQETKNTFLRQNSVFGLFIGLSFIVASQAFYIAGKSICINPQLNNVLMLLSIAGAFIGARKYRDETLQGAMTYAKALGSCVYIIAVGAVCYGVYLYIFYSQQPALMTYYTDTLESALREVYAGNPLLENMLTMTKAFITPGAIAFGEIFNKVFTGFIFSLFLAGLLRRNPQIQKPTNE